MPETGAKKPPKWYKAMNKRQHTLLPMWPGFAILGSLFYPDLLINRQLTVYEDGLGDYYTHSEDCFRASLNLAKRVRKNPEFWREYDEKAYSRGERDRRQLLNVGKGKYGQVTGNSLRDLLNELMETLKLQGGTLTMARIVAQKEIDEFLKGEGLSEQGIQEANTLIRVPHRRSFPEQEILAFKEIALKSQSGISTQRLTELLKEHQYLWGWITTDLHYGNPLTVEELRHRLEEEKSQTIQEEIKKMEDNYQQSRKDRRELIDDLKPDPYLRGQMEMIAFETWLKTYRRYFTTQAVFYALDFFNELARRARVDLELLWWATPNEIEGFLKNRKKLNQDALVERKEFLVLVTKDQKNKILTGNIARKLLESEVKPEKIAYEKVLKGTATSLGFGEGKAKVVLDHSKVEEMVREGDVIVATQTPPSFIRAIKKASAVVVEEGAITSHASLLCREFGRPCIVGIKGATKVIKSGDELRVNAKDGVVEIL